MDFSDKVVLITGASSGIGAATAVHFSKLSATLALVGRKENNLKKVALDCEKFNGNKPLIIVADVTNDSDLERVVNETIDKFGKINVLVNNAGIAEPESLKNSNLEIYDRTMTVNLRAVYYLTTLCTPHLIKSKGCVVNVSSCLSTKPNTAFIAYTMAKAALDQFTKCAALELGSDGVRVNSVNPGYILTNLLKDVGFTNDQLKMYEDNMRNTTPLKKLTTSDEVAALIAFYSSENVANITGTCVVIDGGYSLNT